MIRIGSRGSQLALWQANHIARLLRTQGHQVTIATITTTGDRLQGVPFARVGSKGMFTKEIEEALLADTIDLAVHSLKDLPTELDARFVIAAVTERVDPRDVFVSTLFSSMDALPAGARVGTSSLRRQSQLRARWPQLEYVDFRGNVDTRLRKLSEGQVEAAVLAAAGLDRLERTEWVRERFSEDVLCPAPGQGALAIECRAADDRTRAVLASLDHAESRFAVTAERVALAALGGGCQVPIGAYCRRDGDSYLISGCVSSPDGVTVLRAEERGADAQVLGATLADSLLRQGALQLLAAGHDAVTVERLAGRRIVVTRAQRQSGGLRERLEEQGAEVLLLPTIEMAPPNSYKPLDDALQRSQNFDWLVVTSANAVQVIGERLVELALSPTSLADLHCAAVGPSTAEALRSMGLTVEVVPERYVGDALADTLKDRVRGQSVLLVRAAVARDIVPDRLTAAGAAVTVMDAYRTVVPADAGERAKAIFGVELLPDAVVFTSGSTVTHLLDVLGEAGIAFPRTVPCVSIGPMTSAALSEAGLIAAAEAETASLDGLVEACVRLFAR